ncbi:oxidoreductase-like domain-containing protein [Amantichitinum ursilacus]|uniref:Oxidoreductase-like domain-containing protein n=1 Tax=Amantichitinum ursilacus TaxID=857265 RepID=A0A0N0XJ90_9NEIS|nr:oxidoreductase-like domain-containing protein [Amantichitinum ursilacus]KPC53582.1 hypothetical protein WG78_08675 [Amantichitinum ursilacus]
MNTSVDSSPQSPADPRPEPPFEPPLEACCGNGCDPCIFDTYGEELRRYRAELKAWEQRHSS